MLQIQAILRDLIFFFAYINHWFVKVDISFLLVTNLFVSNMVFSHMQTACTIKQNLFSIRNNSDLSILLDTSQLSFKFNKSINSAFNEKWTRAFRDCKRLSEVHLNTCKRNNSSYSTSYGNQIHQMISRASAEINSLL